MSREYEIYVVDEVKAAIYWGAPVAQGTVVSRGTDSCEIANCGACGTLHGIAKPEILERNGLAAREV